MGNEYIWRSYRLQRRKICDKTNTEFFGASVDYLIEKNILKIPNYIKIDVDGAEDKILSGGLKFLVKKC